MIYFKKL